MTVLRCHGEGEITVNPAYPDPRGETSVRCPGCSDCRDLYGYDADRDLYSETGVYDDHPRPRRLLPRASQPDASTAAAETASPNAGSPSSPVTGRRDVTAAPDGTPCTRREAA